MRDPDAAEIRKSLTCVQQPTLRTFQTAALALFTVGPAAFELWDALGLRFAENPTAETFGPLLARTLALAGTQGINASAALKDHLLGVLADA